MAGRIRRSHIWKRSSSPDSLLLLPRPCGRKFFFQDNLRRRQARNGHEVRRRADIVHPHPMAELHALGVAAVLAADAHLQFRARRAPAFDPPSDQHPDTRTTESLERVGGKNSRLLLIYVV